MKKVLYALAIALMIGASTMSCTDENVQPETQTSSGGNGSDPKN